MARIAFGHHVVRFEDRVSDLSNRKAFVVSSLSRDHRSVRCQHKMDTGIGHQVGLELSHVDIEGTIETQGGCQGRNDLRNQSVQVSVGWAFDAKVAATDIIKSFVVKAEGTVRVL